MPRANWALLKTKVDVTSRNATTYSNKSDKTSLAGGVGVGFKPLANVGVEATTTIYQKIPMQLVLGAHLAFNC